MFWVFLFVENTKKKKRKKKCLSFFLFSKWEFILFLEKFNRNSNFIEKKKEEFREKTRIIIIISIYLFFTKILIFLAELVVFLSLKFLKILGEKKKKNFLLISFQNRKYRKFWRNSLKVSDGLPFLINFYLSSWRVENS